MTQTYLVPQKTANSIVDEHFSKIVHLKTEVFTKKVRSSKKYTDALALETAIQRAKASKLNKEYEDKINKLKEIIDFLKKQEVLNLNLVKQLFISFNIFSLSMNSSSVDEYINYDFNKAITNTITYNNDNSLSIAKNLTDLKFSLGYYDLAQITSDIKARIVNRIRMFKIESYDNIVNKINKLDFDSEIAEIHSILLELNDK